MAFDQVGTAASYAHCALLLPEYKQARAMKDGEETGSGTAHVGK